MAASSDFVGQLNAETCREEDIEPLVRSMLLRAGLSLNAAALQAALGQLNSCLCGGNPQRALEEIRAACGGSSTCGKVLKSGSNAYKCKTCGNDPTCIVCVDCFQQGNHEGHDYYLIRAGGGVCDCGDATAWAPEGFCRKHKGQGADEDPSANLSGRIRGAASGTLRAVLGEVYRTAHALVVCFCCGKDDKLRSCAACHGLARYCSVECQKKHWTTHKPFCERKELFAVDAIRLMVEWLQKVMTLFGDPVRRLMWKAMEDPAPSGDGCLLDAFFNLEMRTWHADVGKAIHTLYFAWLQDRGFKYFFTKHFVQFYKRFVVYVPPKHRDKEQKRLHILSISVQVLTVPEVGLRLCLEDDLWSVLLDTNDELIRPGLIPGPENTQIVSDMAEYIARSQYQEILGDMNYVMRLDECAQILLFEDGDGLRKFTESFGRFENCHLNTRAVDEHVLHENAGFEKLLGPVYMLGSLAVTASLAFAKGPRPGQGDIISAQRSALRGMAAVLEAWLASVGVKIKGKRLPVYDVLSKPVSAMLPLHRLFTRCAAAAVDHVPPQALMSGITADVHAFAVAVMEHPMRAQAMSAQSRTGLWVRNGWIHQVECMQYARGEWHMRDVDTCALQLCASCLHPSIVAAHVARTFGVGSPGLYAFTMREACAPPPGEGREKEDEAERARKTGMLMEETLELIIRLARGRNTLSEKKQDALRFALLHRLAISDQPHSLLLKAATDVLPSGEDDTTSLVEPVLAELATTHRSGEDEALVYRLRPAQWAHFDPYFEGYTKAEREEALERYALVLKNPPRDAPPLPTVPRPPPLVPLPVFATLPALLWCASTLAMVQIALTAGVARGKLGSHGLIVRALHVLHLGVTAGGMTQACDQGDGRWEERGWAELQYPTGRTMADIIRTEGILSQLLALHSSPEEQLIAGVAADLIKMIAGADPLAREVIVAHSPRTAALLGESAGGAQTSADPAEARKRAARDRQKAIMEKFAKKQQNFADKQIAAVAVDTAQEDEGPESRGAPTWETPTMGEGEQTCVQCREGAQPGRPLGLIGLGLCSSVDALVQSHARAAHHWGVASPAARAPAVAHASESDDEDVAGPPREAAVAAAVPAATTATTTAAVTATATVVADSASSGSSGGSGKASDAGESDGAVEMDPVVSAMEDLPPFPAEKRGVLVRSCGHCMHFDCFDAFFTAMLREGGQQLAMRSLVVSLDRGQYQCPLCKSLSNTLVPLMDGPDAPDGALGIAALAAVDGLTARLFLESDLSEDIYVGNRGTQHSLLWDTLANTISTAVRTAQARRTSEIPVCASFEKAPELPVLRVVAAVLHCVSPYSETERERVLVSALARLRRPMMGEDEDGPARVSLITDAFGALVSLCALDSSPERFAEFIRLVWALMLAQAVVCIVGPWYGAAAERTCLDVLDVSGMRLTEADKALVARLVVPPLQRAAMLGHVLAGVSLSYDWEDEIDFLLARLGLPLLADVESGADNAHDVLMLASTWLAQVTPEALRAADPPLFPDLNSFAFCPLPESYDAIANSKRRCMYCNHVPTKGAVCLLCGEVVCLGGCQKSDFGPGRCNIHMKSCGKNTGVFLAMQSSSVLLLSAPGRGCFWGSLYLDSHGEEDIGLKRGRPLKLSEERVHKLVQLFVGQRVPAEISRRSQRAATHRVPFIDWETL